MMLNLSGYIVPHFTFIKTLKIDYDIALGNITISAIF